MALSNIFKEPRREITESIFGTVTIDGEQWVTAELLPYKPGQVIAWAHLPRGMVP
jgi:hypothetical protein